MPGWRAAAEAWVAKEKAAYEQQMKYLAEYQRSQGLPITADVGGELHPAPRVPLEAANLHDLVNVMRGGEASPDFGADAAREFETEQPIQRQPANFGGELHPAIRGPLETAPLPELSPGPIQRNIEPSRPSRSLDGHTANYAPGAYPGTTGLRLHDDSPQRPSLSDLAAIMLGSDAGNDIDMSLPVRGNAAWEEIQRFRRSQTERAAPPLMTDQFPSNLTSRSDYQDGLMLPEEQPVEDSALGPHRAVGYNGGHNHLRTWPGFVQPGQYPGAYDPSERANAEAAAEQYEYEAAQRFAQGYEPGFHAREQAMNELGDGATVEQIVRRATQIEHPAPVYDDTQPVAPAAYKDYAQPHNTPGHVPAIQNMEMGNRLEREPNAKWRELAISRLGEAASPDDIYDLARTLANAEFQQQLVEPTNQPHNTPGYVPREFVPRNVTDQPIDDLVKTMSGSVEPAEPVTATAQPEAGSLYDAASALTRGLSGMDVVGSMNRGAESLSRGYPNPGAQSLQGLNDMPNQGDLAVTAALAEARRAAEEQAVIDSMWGGGKEPIMPTDMHTGERDPRSPFATAEGRDYDYNAGLLEIARRNFGAGGGRQWQRKELFNDLRNRLDSQDAARAESEAAAEAKKRNVAGLEASLAESSVQERMAKAHAKSVARQEALAQKRAERSPELQAEMDANQENIQKRSQERIAGIKERREERARSNKLKRQGLQEVELPPGVSSEQFAKWQAFVATNPSSRQVQDFFRTEGIKQTAAAKQKFEGEQRDKDRVLAQAEIDAKIEANKLAAANLKAHNAASLAASTEANRIAGLRLENEIRALDKDDELNPAPSEFAANQLLIEEQFDSPLGQTRDGRVEIIENLKAQKIPINQIMSVIKERYNATATEEHPEGVPFDPLDAIRGFYPWHDPLKDLGMGEDDEPLASSSEERARALDLINGLSRQNDLDREMVDIIQGNRRSGPGIRRGR